jgi:hypothetical protein
MSLIYTAILFFVDKDDVELAMPVIRSIGIYLEFMTEKLDKHTLEYLQDKLEFVEMLIMCGVDSAIRDCLHDMHRRFQRYVVSKGLIANRLKKQIIQDEQLGDFALLPYDLRLNIARYTT